MSYSNMYQLQYLHTKPCSVLTTSSSTRQQEMGSWLNHQTLNFLFISWSTPQTNTKQAPTLFPTYILPKYNNILSLRHGYDFFVSVVNIHKRFYTAITVTRITKNCHRS